MRLIDADALIKTLDTTSKYPIPAWLRAVIIDAPTIEERKIGHWIKAIDELGEAWSCSECTTEFTVDEMSEFHKWAKYCPECGSYNGGEHDETD